MTEIPTSQIPTIETPYGILKRLQYVNSVIESFKPRTVLDIGCGTGVHLTHPLAQRHPHIQFLGMDSDVASIDWANEHTGRPNLVFSTETDGNPDQSFDLIIASEVLEHVEDPVEFLCRIQHLLANDGKAILTVPNGYGPFEVATFFENLLRLSGLYKLVVALVRLIRNNRPFFPASEIGSSETLAASPHINFFSLGVLRNLIAASGFRITSFQSRTLLCGLFFDQAVQGLKLQDWNARIADRLSPQFASDWMFVLKPADTQNPITYSRRLDARVRRYLNEKRMGL